MVSGDARAKVLDFGLAGLGALNHTRDADAETTTVTEQGMVMVTIGYMSPEQAIGGVGLRINQALGPTSQGTALAANSLSPRKERRTMCELSSKSRVRDKFRDAAGFAR
jgi:serine/threonine protein kinase